MTFLPDEEAKGFTRPSDSGVNGASPPSLDDVMRRRRRRPAFRYYHAKLYARTLPILAIPIYFLLWVHFCGWEFVFAHFFGGGW